MPKLWHMPESQRGAMCSNWKVSLTAFTDAMENLLAKVHLSIDDTSDKIKEASTDNGKYNISYWFCAKLHRWS